MKRILLAACFGFLSTSSQLSAVYANHVARLTIGAGVGVAHGLLNNWLVCRTKFTKQNSVLYHAPYGEWLSAIIPVLRAFHTVNWVESEAYRCPRHDVRCNRSLFGLYALQLAVQGLAQMVGEAAPITKGGWRNYAVNFQLGLAGLAGLFWLIGKCGFDLHAPCGRRYDP